MNFYDNLFWFLLILSLFTNVINQSIIILTNIYFLIIFYTWYILCCKKQKTNGIESKIKYSQTCINSLHANPLALSLGHIVESGVKHHQVKLIPGQVKLDSDKWKLWMYLFKLTVIFSKLGFRGSRWKTLRQRLY